MWDGSTIVATAVGGSGLFVAVWSLGWQIRRARFDRRTRVRVRLTRAAVSSPRFLQDELLVIAAVNESSHPVRVTKVGLDYDTKGRAGIAGAWGWDPPTEATIPGVIEARDTGITTTALRIHGQYVGLVGGDVEVRAYVFTADGSRFQSEWVRADRIPGAIHLAQLPVSDSVRQLIEHTPQAPG